MLEISVLMAQFPSQEIARLSYDYRTLGLGYRQPRRPADGCGHSLRQRRGAARICGAITAIMTGVAYATSAEMAGELGAFPGYEANRERDAPRHPQPPPRRLRRSATATRACRSPPVPLDAANCPDTGAGRGRAKRAWDRALATGRAARLPQRPGRP